MNKTDLFWTTFFQYLLERYPDKRLYYDKLNKTITLWKLNIQEYWWINNNKTYEISIRTEKWWDNRKKANTINELKELIETPLYKENISIIRTVYNIANLF